MCVRSHHSLRELEWETNKQKFHILPSDLDERMCVSTSAVDVVVSVLSLSI